MTAAPAGYDLAVVGAGICGLAHALAAARLGKRVVVVDRDARANGASVRNFGFVTVSGQQRGACWERAMRSREVWAEIAPRAGIEVVQRGLTLAARRPEALAVVEAFLGTDMGRGCRLLRPEEARARLGGGGRGTVLGALDSPHELRVESRHAIPRLARYLEDAHGVAFLRGALVGDVAPPAIRTTHGRLAAEACVVCPGDDFLTLFPERLAAYGLTRCKLHMLRVAPPEPGRRLATPVMTDLSLARYLGFAELPAAAALRARLEREQPEHLANGVHLIVVQSADGSLVVGDSHRYDATPDPFAPEEVDRLILDELGEVLPIPEPRVVERWIGTYASGPGLMLVDRPADAVRVVVITSGTGASTSFAIGEEVVAELFG